MKYQCPKDCPGVTLLDTFYQADANGIVDVPNTNNDMLENGYTLYIEPLDIPQYESVVTEAEHE